jgi:hypothetical protein
MADLRFKLSHFVIAGLTRTPPISKNNQEIAGQARNDVLYYHVTI